jgi:hypothetical protein
MNFVLAFLMIPPEATYHNSDLITEGFQEIKATHRECWDGLRNCLDQDLLSRPRQKKIVPPLHVLTNTIFQISKGAHLGFANLHR